MTSKGPFQPTAFHDSKRGWIWTGYKEKTFYDGDGETLARVTQSGGRCSITGNIQGQVGCGSEQLDLVEDVPAHCRGV